MSWNSVLYIFIQKRPKIYIIKIFIVDEWRHICGQIHLANNGYHDNIDVVPQFNEYGMTNNIQTIIVFGEPIYK